MEIFKESVDDVLDTLKEGGSAAELPGDQYKGLAQFFYSYFKDKSDTLNSEIDTMNKGGGKRKKRKSKKSKSKKSKSKKKRSKTRRKKKRY